jgi:CRISPR/Cas system-associated exonuclease Cas4 (RecB family)
VYITSERIRWRWSKGAHVAVNGAVKYYVDGRKLHVLDNDDKEHTMEIVKEIRKVTPTVSSVTSAQADNSQLMATQATAGPASQASVTIDSTPPRADIEIDGAFVGNTPSTVSVAPGRHQIAVKKKGFTDWTKTLNVTGGSIHLNAELEQASAK